MRATDSLPGLRGLPCPPHSILGPIRGQTNDPVAILNELQTAFEGFRTRNDARIDAIEALVDARLLDRAASQFGGGSAVAPLDPKYTEVFTSYLRRGAGEHELRAANGEGFRGQVNAAMTTSSPSEGGYLAPTEWDRQVRKQLSTISPMRRLATVMQSGVQAYSTVWHDGLWGSGWVGETAARPGTTTPAFSSIEFSAGEIYANAAITQRMLDDSETDVESWLTAEIAGEFARQEGIAFLSGDGVNKPFGLLTHVAGGAAAGRHPGGNLTVVETAAIGDPQADDFVDFAYSLPAPYRQGATWLMNSTTAAKVAKLKDGQGAYIWREGLVAGQPATLLGYPVEIDESMPHVAGGALAVAFGAFSRGYLINDRAGVRILRDPYTNKPFVNFYLTKRVGAGVVDPHAIRLMKIKA